MVNCSKCGHEFLCDREKLIPKKPFARAKKAVTVHTPKDRREAIQSALMETGLIQLMCLCFFTMPLPRWTGPFSFPCCSSLSRRRSPCFSPVLRGA